MNTNCCRFCETRLEHVFVDLGMSPLSNAFLGSDQLHKMEPFYPLCAYVCDKCFLVQLSEFESPEAIFSDYAYFSSYSDTWLAHARAYTQTMIERFGLDQRSRVIEIASNDGYLLQYFKARGIPVLGIEPAANVAEIARGKEIPCRTEFFSAAAARRLAQEGLLADLLLGNNVLAHVPNINDFVAGLKIGLKADGVITMEFPHLMRLIQENQFDTIYHEHFSYFSLSTVESVFAKHGLRLFDVEELPTHGGSLRIFACHTEDRSKGTTENIHALKKREADAGMSTLHLYKTFNDKARETKRNLLDFLINAKRGNKQVVAYGAPAKGNTLLNYCGVRQDFLNFTVDRSPHKAGRFLPGTHIPIYDVPKLAEARPDFVLILPWNIKEEIISQIAYIREWGGKFVVPIPNLEVLE